MSTPQQRITRDYLKRHGWIYALGLIIHLVATTGSWWTRSMVLLGLFGGSAFILMFELVRGGNATARTMLSLPVTAGQLARAWRFVAFSLPATLFFGVLVLGALVAASLDAPHFNLERFSIIALTQTSMLGIIYFALTGLPGQPRIGATIADRVHDIFFGLVWGLSMPAVLLWSVNLPMRWSQFDTPHIIGGLVLLAGTVAGWFRAEELVRQRAARPGAPPRRKPAAGSRRHAAGWKGFGGLPYLIARFGSVTGVVFFFILFFGWFFVNLGSWMDQSGRSGSFQQMQIGMFLPIMAFVTLTQLLSQLRVLRTMPMSRAQLTSLVLFWPLVIVAILGCLAFGALSGLSGEAFDWSTYAACIVGATLIQLSLPFILRFGLSMRSMLPIFFLFTFGQIMSSSFKEFGFDLAESWAWVLLFVCVLLVGSWTMTYRLFASPHPWRVGLLRMPGMQRRM